MYVKLRWFLYRLRLVVCCGTANAGEPEVPCEQGRNLQSRYKNVLFLSSVQWYSM